MTLTDRPDGSAGEALHPAAFDAAWLQWLHANDIKQLDRDASLRRAIATYLRRAGLSDRRAPDQRTAEADVERVARAIYEADAKRYLYTTRWDELRGGKITYEDHARDAIAALSQASQHATQPKAGVKP